MSKNTTIYLENLKREGIAKTEALKAQTKRAFKAFLLYGTATVSICTAAGLGITVGVLKVQDLFENNRFVQPGITFHAPEVTLPHFEAKIQPKTVLVQNDTLRTKVIANAKDKTLVQKVYDAFAAKGLSGQKAVAVMYAESGGNCNAVGINADSADLGLFQLNTKYQLPKSNLKDFGDCDKNLEYAVNLVAEQGWGVFSTVNNGAYLRYMDTEVAYKSE